MKRICRVTLLLFICVCLNSIFLFAQTVQRPALWGIAKMTFLISDYGLAQSYYGDFLGYDKAFSYGSSLGEVVSYKVNDRQFLEFVRDNDAKSKNRLVVVSFETENAEQMRQYLASKGVKVPASVQTDKAGNIVFLVHDPNGVPIEFLQWGENSLHRKSKGKYISENRISPRIHHAGLYIDKLLDNPVFYTEILGFRSVFRAPEDMAQEPQIIYFQIGEGSEMIEHHPTDTHNFAHPCFVAMDMQDVIYTLKERRKTERLGRPMIGKGKKWLLNLQNADGTRVEFVEMHNFR